MIFSQSFLIHSRLVIVSFREACGYYLHKVLITGIVFSEKYQVKITVISVRCFLVKSGSGSDVYLTAYDRFYSLPGTFLVEIDDAVHDTVIGDRSGIHTELFDPGHIFLYLV